jgi:acyl-CoA synthetase (AMP-forming)/AMP-acid ligase II
VEAVVQLRPEVSVTVDDLNAHVRTQIAGYKAPRRYCFVEKVERQPSGKPDYKWALRVASGDLGEV